jgi:hypothetical protein
MPEPRKEIDAALDTAVRRVREAEGQFVETPVGTDDFVERALQVEQRAEDVEELASDAVDVSDEPPA